MTLINDTLNGLIKQAQQFEGTEDLEELQNRDYSKVKVRFYLFSDCLPVWYELSLCFSATAYVLFVLSLATAMQTATETQDGRCFGGQAGMMMSTTGGGGGGVGGGSPGNARLCQFDEFETVRLTDACFDDLEARDRNRRGD